MGCGGARAEIQVSRREIHTHIHLDYAKVEILSCIKKIKKNDKFYSFSRLEIFDSLKLLDIHIISKKEKKKKRNANRCP